MSAPAAPGLSLSVPTAEAGFDLAIHLSRLAVKAMQGDATVRGVLRESYAHDAGLLTAASHVVATHFATIAAANNYWRPA